MCVLEGGRGERKRGVGGGEDFLLFSIDCLVTARSEAV